MAALTQLKTLQSKESIVSGITNHADLMAAHAAGATYAGFIFVLTSPYGIAIEDAKEIAKAVQQALQKEQTKQAVRSGARLGDTN